MSLLEFRVYVAYGIGSKPIIRGFDANDKSYVDTQDIEFKTGNSEKVVDIIESDHIRILNCNIYAEQTNTEWIACSISFNSNYNFKCSGYRGGRYFAHDCLG